MAGLRYNDDPFAGMSDSMRSTARKNLADTDASVSAFNDRMKFFPTRTMVPQPSTVPVGGDNWRFKSFGPSLLKPKPSPLSEPESTFQSSTNAYKTNPAAYATSPEAYHQVISSYKPKDMTKESSLYGWGGE